MRKNIVNLPDLLANTTANMTLQELTNFRRCLAEVLPAAILEAAELARTQPAQAPPAVKPKTSKPQQAEVKHDGKV